MHPLLNTAVSAARKAGKIIIRAMNTGETLEITEKRHNDFVTQIDPACEAAIVNTIHTAYPDHNFLCEESGEIKHSDGPYCWVIDPLDGTTNFIHRLPYIAISIALQKNGKTVLGLVYNPITQDLFTAELGNGAMLNDRRIRVSNTSKLEGSFVTAMVPKGDLFKPSYRDYYADLQVTCAGVRRCGAAALDIAYVASGTFDAYWVAGARPWDLAAGILLVQEAGGMIANLDGTANFPHEGNLLACNPKLMKHLLPAVSQQFNP